MGSPWNSRSRGSPAPTPTGSWPPRPRRRRRPRRLPSLNDWRSSSVSNASEPVGPPGSVPTLVLPSDAVGSASVTVPLDVSAAGAAGEAAEETAAGGSRTGRGAGSRSASSDAPPSAFSSSARAARESSTSSEVRAERTRRGFAASVAGAASVSAPFAASVFAPFVPPAPAVARIASMRSALRMRVAPFTPTAPAMVWSCSRSLPSSIDRSICWSGLMWCSPSVRPSARASDPIVSLDGIDAPENGKDGKTAVENQTRISGTGSGGPKEGAAPTGGVFTLPSPPPPSKHSRERRYLRRRAISSCATTGVVPATPRSEYSPPGPATSES